MSEINCNNCAISDFKESLCDRCDEMKRLGRAEDIEKLLIKAFSEVDSQAKSDCISRQRAIKAINTWDKFGVDERGRLVRWHEGLVLYVRLRDVLTAIVNLPSAQPEQRCVNCGRTVNNGGWYEDGRTRCPIEEHYALPKDGHCHLWEKIKVWEDDYVKRSEEGEE